MIVTSLPIWTATDEEVGISFCFLADEMLRHTVAEKVYREIYNNPPAAECLIVERGLKAFDDGSEVWIVTKDWTVLEKGYE